MRPIPIYSAEVEAGVVDAINAEENRAIADDLPLIVDPKITDHFEQLVQDDSISQVEKSIATNLDQFDLHYLYTILATVGWNRNDDVFDRYETFSARHSAEDKPFNLEHDPNKIIGHITGNYVVDQNHNHIDDAVVVDELPDVFHILTSAVIYKHLKSKDTRLTQATAELLAQINRGEWFVSMECLFSNFDYAMIMPDGNHKVVARNEASAFLSKHLRIYGGQGNYQGNRIGRLMRNLTFSGKGLVRKPGNPFSLVLKSEQFEGVLASETFNQKVEEEQIMSETSNVQEQETIRALKETQKSLEARLKQMDEKQVQAKFDALNITISDKDAEIDSLKTQLTETNSKVVEADKAKVELEEAKASQDAKLQEAEQKLSDIEASAKRTGRVSSLVDKGVNKADAESIADKFEGISDEQFEAIVETQAELVKAKATETVTEPEPGDEALTPEEQALADITNGDEEPALSTTAEDTQGELQQACSSYFAHVLSADQK